MSGQYPASLRDVAPILWDLFTELDALELHAKTCPHDPCPDCQVHVAKIDRLREAARSRAALPPASGIGAVS